MEYNVAFEVKYHQIEQELSAKAASGTMEYTAADVEEVCHLLYKEELGEVMCNDVPRGLGALMVLLGPTRLGEHVAHDGTTYGRNKAVFFVAALCSHDAFHWTHRLLQAGDDVSEELRETMAANALLAARANVTLGSE
jgi:hypothetical protein